MISIRRSLLAALVAFSGCSSTPDPIYYLLPTPKLEAGASFNAGTIAVREIEMPLYARAQQVASRAQDGSVFLSDDHRWADEPARASTRAFVAALKQRTGAAIVAEPWPASVAPVVRLDIAVDRFIGGLTGGDVEFTGQYRIVRTGESANTQDTFSYLVPIEGSGYKALAAAHSAAIGKLAGEIATKLVGAGS